MSNLYEMATALTEIMMLIDENDGCYDEQCLLDTWEALDGEFDDKVESWCKVIRNMESEILSIKSEKDRLDKKIKNREKAMLRMKSKLAELMLKAEKPKIKTTLFNVNRVKLNGKLVVERSEVPDELKKEQVSRIPDNDKIRELLDKGEKLTFAKYYNSLTIQ